jgi:hypothetical protein
LEFENPQDLLRRLKLGREEYCQRLLTMLILEGPYPRWNSRSQPSAAGAEFLRALYERNFGGTWPGDDAVFVDEFELPPRNDTERGGAPDYAVLWDDRLWLIELKTEKASHRPDQIPTYFDLAHHHYPDAAVEVLYVTPPMLARYEAPAPWGRYAHATWTQLAELIRSTGHRATSLASRRRSMAFSPRSLDLTCDRRSGGRSCWRRPSRSPKRASKSSARRLKLRSRRRP